MNGGETGFNFYLGLKMLAEDCLRWRQKAFNFYYRLKKHPCAGAHEGYLAVFAIPLVFKVSSTVFTCLQTAFK